MKAFLILALGVRVSMGEGGVGTPPPSFLAKIDIK